MRPIVTPPGEPGIGTGRYLAAMTRWTSRLETAAFRAVMGLPPFVVRRIAGRPVILDGQVLDPQTQWMLRVEKLVKEPPVASLPIPEGRVAVRRQSALVGGRQPVGRTDDLEVPTPAGPMRARLYTPTGFVDGGTSGLLVFLHGGGMIYGDLDSHDAPCRLLAERAGVRVLALDYRLAPEHRYPAAVDDCWAGYQWAIEHAEELAVDPDRVAVGGDSAGGYLSAVVAIRAANAGVPCAFQLLVSPVTDHVHVSPSRRMFAQGFYLDQAFMDLAVESYLGPDGDRADPEVSVQLTEKLPDGLAPALVVTAGFD